MNSAVFFLLVVIATTNSESTSSDDVLNLTAANFEDALKENEFVLVEFCKSLPFICLLVVFFKNLTCT